MSAQDSGNNRALILFSREHRWASLLVRKLEHAYEVHSLVAGPIFLAGGSRAVEQSLLEAIVEHRIGTVFIDAEFFPVVDILTVQCIAQGILRVLLCFDDALQHEMNLVVALNCHAVLTTDPVSVVRYQQRGVPAHLLCLEANPDIYFPQPGTPPRCDVLFFGDQFRGDRPMWLSYLASQGVDVYIPQRKDFSYVELADLIRHARIVLNFSKVSARPYAPFQGGSDAPYVYFKGRIVEAGLSGVPCVSEFFPGTAEMFGQDVLPCFSTPEECLAIVRDLLGDEERRKALGDALRQHCLKLYADMPQCLAIREFLGGRLAASKSLRAGNATYCAHLVTRKLFRLVPGSPRVFVREFARLACGRALGGGVVSNLVMVTALTVLSAIGVMVHLVRQRRDQAA